MVMVEGHTCLDLIGVNSQDEELDMNLLNFWDFPLENFGVDDFVGEWDDSKSECLGPIPLETLMVPTFQRNKYDHVDKVHESNQLACYAAPENSRSQFLIQTKSSSEDLGLFETQSPVSALESSGSCSTGILAAIPAQPRSKTVRRRPRLKPWNMIPLWHSTESSAKTNSKRYKEGNKRFSQLSIAVETKKDSSQKRACTSHASNSTEQQNATTKKCSHCLMTKTPQWREGPEGPKTLCNACGVRFRSGRLFAEYRPAASPTFVPALHSNSHKKVMEMRDKATTSTTTTRHECKKDEPLALPREK